MARDTVHLVFMLCALRSVLGAPTQSNTSDTRSVNDGYWNIPIRIFESCYKEDIVVCLGTKAVAALDRVSRTPSYQIIEGVHLIQNEDVSRLARSSTDKEIQESIEAAPEGKSARIVKLVGQSVDRLLKTYSLRFQVSADGRRSLQNAFEKGKRCLVTPVCMMGIPLSSRTSLNMVSILSFI